MASISINDGQKVVIRLDERDAKGNSAFDPGSWSFDRPDLVTVTPSADGLSAEVRPLGPTGVVNVSAIVGTLPSVTAQVTITGGPATTVELAFDAPTAL